MRSIETPHFLIRNGRVRSRLPGDLISNGMVVPMWGLHLVDVNLVLGDLIELVGRQTKAYLARH